PLAVAVLRSGAKVYVASERDDCVYVINTSEATSPKLAQKISTGAHPIATVLSEGDKRLYVSNSLSDTVSVNDTDSDRVVDPIMLRPAAVRDIPGVTPTGFALSPDKKTLYVSLGDMNAVAIIDLEDREVRGYLPTGWYPSSLLVSTDGKRLFVAN